MVCFASIGLVLALESHAQPVQLVNAFPALTFTRPVLVTHAGDGSNRVFVVQQDGLIRVFPNDSAVSSSTTFLNITNRLSSTSGEEGLLGLAFHPNYVNNGYFYVNYTAPSPRRTVIARYSVTPGNPNKADSLSGQILMEINQPYSNHNGGMILFGLDGYLYIATGDGGSANDPGNRSQNLDSLLGKILRINIDTTSPGLPYAIPPDNPRVGLSGRDEIYAPGFRNPWRMSVDPVTGQIWVGDVGQNSWEEIDLLELGKNYGWRCYEGNNTFNTSGCGSISLYTFPKKVYPRSSPNCSVTGGVVYRGFRRPDLVGRYIYGDYCSGMIWKFLYTGSGITEDALIHDAPFPISSFGTDEPGELYICNYSSGTIHRFAGNPTVTTSLVSPVNASTGIPITTELVWQSAAGATRYWLQLDNNADFTSPEINDSTLTDTLYLPAGLQYGTGYHWRVRVKNAIGWGSPSTEWKFTTIVQVPAVPVLESPEDGSQFLSSSLTLDWSGTAVTFHLQVSTDSLFQSVTMEDSSLTGSEMSVSGLAAGTAYYWRVRGKNDGGTSGWTQAWQFTTAPVVTNQYQVTTGWNLISLALDVNDSRKSVLFPTAISQAYRYGSQGYTAVDTLVQGRGYWLKFPVGQNVDITGIERGRDTIDVHQGWNLIGSTSWPVDTEDIVQVPSGIVQSLFFGYNGTYFAADTINPSKAYWVKAATSGQLIVTRTTPPPGAEIVKVKFVEKKKD